MTAEEWEGCAYIDRLKKAVGWNWPRRKDRLFGVACCRPFWGLLSDEKARQAVELAERAADDEELLPSLEEIRAALRFRDHTSSDYLAHLVACPQPSRVCRLARDLRRSTHGEQGGQEEEARHAYLFREVLGNPFRPVTVSPLWVTADVRSLAQAASDERHLPSGHLDLTCLAVLADALEEAGATGDILTHLRSPGPHMRGCWAVDLILGRVTPRAGTPTRERVGYDQKAP
jgi:hypothetical protein